MTDTFIYDAVRTPRGRGKADGSLHEVTALNLASQALAAIKDRHDLDPVLLDDVVLGCVDPVGEAGGDIARVAAIMAGFGHEVPGIQINRFCASGLDAVNFAAAEIMSGDLGKAAAVLTAAFSQDVLDGRLSPMVEVEKGRGVVLRATDHKLPQQKPLEAVRIEVVAAWKKQRGAELAAAAAADAVKRLTAGETLEAVAKSLGAAAQPAKFVARADQAVPLDIRRQAFDAPKPNPKPVYLNFPLGGDAAVLAVTAVRDDPSIDPKEGEGQLKLQFAQQWASGEAQSYAVAARANAKVTVNPQALD